MPMNAKPDVRRLIREAEDLADREISKARRRAQAAAGGSAQQRRARLRLVGETDYARRYRRITFAIWLTVGLGAGALVALVAWADGGLW